MRALAQIESWPVGNAVAAAVTDGGVIACGDTDRPFRLASVTKLMTAWAALIAVEEGTIGLEDPAGQDGCTLRHLLSHAGGYPFTGARPIAAPGARRIYSNTGVELAADAVASATGIDFSTYITEAVFAPLGMSATRLAGSPAFGAEGTAADLCRFVAELMSPTLISADTATAARSPQFPSLSGVVPGVGRFSPCPWGLGPEIRGDKAPHWTGTMNSPSTFGHFGGSGTFVWVDPACRLGLVALTDRPFDDWASDALRLWPQLSDSVIEEAAAA